MAEEKSTMFAPYDYKGAFNEFQPFHEDSYPDERVLEPVQERADSGSDSGSDGQSVRHQLLRAIYSPAEPEERVLSEEERLRLAHMKSCYFQPMELKDGLPITVRRPTRPTRMSYDGTQTPNRFPPSGATSHPRRFLKWTAIVAGAAVGGAVAILFVKPKPKRNK